MTIKQTKILLFFTLIFLTFAYSASFAEENITKNEEIQLIENKNEEPVADNPDSLLNGLENTQEEIIVEETQKPTLGSENEENNSDEILLKMNHGEFIILNKITAKSEKISLALSKPKRFGSTEITMHQCIKNTDPFDSNNIILISVVDHINENETKDVFQGWVFTNNPSLSTIEHPVYEILPINCFSINKESKKQKDETKE